MRAKVQPPQQYERKQSPKHEEPIAESIAVVTKHCCTDASNTTLGEWHDITHQEVEEIRRGFNILSGRFKLAFRVTALIGTSQKLNSESTVRVDTPNNQTVLGFSKVGMASTTGIGVAFN